jgi:hypothetical protein
MTVNQGVLSSSLRGRAKKVVSFGTAFFILAQLTCNHLIINLVHIYLEYLN